MAAVSVRDLDDRVKDKLRRRAAANGRSMEAEIRAILADAVGESASGGIVRVLGERARAAGGVDLELPPRDERARGAHLT